MTRYTNGVDYSDAHIERETTEERKESHVAPGHALNGVPYSCA